MTNIQMFQAIVAKALIALAAVHVPILMVVAWALDRDMGTTMLVATVLAAAPLLAWYLRRPILIVGLALVVTLVGQTNIDTGAYHSYPERNHSGYENVPKWAGLTCVCLDDWKFFKATPVDFKEVQPFTINRSDVI